MHLGNGKGNPGLLHNTAQRPPLLTSPAYLESARQERQPSHVRMLAPRLTLPIFRRIMRPPSERSYKALYLQQLHVLHSSTQRERLQSLVLTTPRLPLSILRRILRPHSRKGHKALYLQQLHVFCSQFSYATLRPHSGKGNPALCLRQRDRQPSPASIAGKATQPTVISQTLPHSQFSDAPCVHTAGKATHPGVSGSGKGNPALPP